MGALYTPQMLALTAELARFPWSADFQHQAEARSTLCGSSIAIGLNTDTDGRIMRLGMKVSACAIGQSSAAILANEAKGVSLKELSATTSALKQWLKGEGELPDWAGLPIIAGALPHKGRHGALLLPWEAATKALSASQ